MFLYKLESLSSCCAVLDLMVCVILYTVLFEHVLVCEKNVNKNYVKSIIYLPSCTANNLVSIVVSGMVFTMLENL